MFLNRYRHLFIVVGTLFVSTGSQKLAAQERTDLVVYGATSAGVITAVQAKKMGKTVVLISPDKHLGGLTSGGLGWTDTGNKAVIGGLARDFYHRVWKKYQEPSAWKWQKREEYGNQGQGNAAIDGEQRTMWIFEPHVAESVFEDLIAEFNIPLYRNEWLDRNQGVETREGKIISITTLSGKKFSGRMFIDATYEGDLMAAAKVPYHVGRESNGTYGEKWNGVQVGILHHRHHFGAVKKAISPFKKPGDESSGLLAEISSLPPGIYGEGDQRIQAYCFRTCLTKHEPNRIPFPKPAEYDPARYELAVRVFEAGWRETFDKFDPIPNHKTDTNNHGPFSSDFIGGNYDYPEASYERRKAIIEAHRRYQQGLLYFWANDPQVPLDVRKAVSEWGLSKDEFLDNGNWPHQLYIREARRLLGQFVMTENELLKRKPTPDSVGMGSYTIDSHNVQRYVTPEGYVQNEGDIGVPTSGPYEIAFGALIPKKEHCRNLLVPVCVSSSHIAFGSIRMEPVFMILGQSAATAAVLAIDQGRDIQDLPYETLRARLLQDRQVLEFKSSETKPQSRIQASKLQGIVVDDDDALLVGDWRVSTASTHYVGNGYRHDGKSEEGKHTATFTAAIPTAGQYEIRMAYPENANRATKVKVEIIHAAGKQELFIDQSRRPPIDGMWVDLAKLTLQAGRCDVVIRNEAVDGFVVVDAIQWIPQTTN